MAKQELIGAKRERELFHSSSSAMPRACIGTNPDVSSSPVLTRPVTDNDLPTAKPRCICLFEWLLAERGIDFLRVAATLLDGRPSLTVPTPCGDEERF